MPLSRRYTLAEINQFDQAAFTAALGHLFEHTPQIVAAAWANRPFATLVDLHQALLRSMDALSTEQQIALIAAHPDLAGRAAIAGDLTAESAHEQASARLDRLTATEYARFHELNTAYRAKFGFPFVICVREHTLPSILEHFAQRSLLPMDAEIRTALGEIGKIAGLRLADAVF